MHRKKKDNLMVIVILLVIFALGSAAMYVAIIFIRKPEPIEQVQQPQEPKSRFNR